MGVRHACDLFILLKRHLPWLLQYNDQSGSVADEVLVWLINQSGGTVKAGTAATLRIAINTLGQA